MKADPKNLDQAIVSLQLARKIADPKARQEFCAKKNPEALVTKFMEAYIQEVKEADRAIDDLNKDVSEASKKASTGLKGSLNGNKIANALVEAVKNLANVQKISDAAEVNELVEAIRKMNNGDSAAVEKAATLLGSAKADYNQQMSALRESEKALKNFLTTAKEALAADKDARDEVSALVDKSWKELAS